MGGMSGACIHTPFGVGQTATIWTDSRQLWQNMCDEEAVRPRGHRGPTIHIFMLQKRLAVISISVYSQKFPGEICKKLRSMAFCSLTPITDRYAEETKRLLPALPTASNPPGDSRGPTGCRRTGVRLVTSVTCVVRQPGKLPSHYPNPPPLPSGAPTICAFALCVFREGGLWSRSKSHTPLEPHGLF